CLSRRGVEGKDSLRKAMWQKGGHCDSERAKTNWGVIEFYFTGERIGGSLRGRERYYRARGEAGEIGRRIPVHRRSGGGGERQRLLYRPAKRPHPEVERGWEAFDLYAAVRAVQRPLLRRQRQPVGLRRREERTLGGQPGGQGHGRAEGL